jgi:hypothetical protein
MKRLASFLIAGFMTVSGVAIAVDVVIIYAADSTAVQVLTLGLIAIGLISVLGGTSFVTSEDTLIRGVVLGVLAVGFVIGFAAMAAFAVQGRNARLLVFGGLTSGLGIAGMGGWVMRKLLAQQ